MTTIRRLSTDDEQSYWAGYMRGTRRKIHGENFGTDADHQKYLSLAGDPDPSRDHRAGISGRVKGSGANKGGEEMKQVSFEAFGKMHGQATLTLDLLQRLMNKHNGEDDYDTLHMTIQAIIRDGENQLDKIFSEAAKQDCKIAEAVV